jgi:hypothetical protein
MKRVFLLSLIFAVLCGVQNHSYAADTVPTDIQQPGTQPQEIGNLSSPDRCDNCHGGYSPSTEPAHNWRGSMMANAGRDPIFWATLSIAEQDFDGAGDLCIRCHGTAGWLAGRSTPTDGSGLASGDSDGVECDFCHKMANPDNSDPILQGEQFSPFIANNEGDPGWTVGDPVIGYYGSGMASMWGGSDMLGPYSDAEARHQFMQSAFHRSVDFCGTCHDVSNPAVGNLAHNNGAQPTAEPVNADGVLGGPVNEKAAFNNFPYAYGIVERTFSEYKSSRVPETLVSNYENLPADLQSGAFQAAYNSALVAGREGNYADGAPRYFSCQTCHLRPVEGQGCNKNPPVRKDLPLHDMTGGNYWMPEAIQWLDARDLLRLGGGLTAEQISAMNDGIPRVQKQLSQAATLVVDKAKDTVTIINHTGHKLISGYPEGRRMWLRITWYDSGSNIIRVDGEYGPLSVQLDTNKDGTKEAYTVNTLLDLHPGNTEIFEAHYGMTQEWASQLIALGYDPNLILSYDRVTGDPDFTLGQLAALAPGSEHETFHFVMNNTVVKDNRIPPYGMRYDDARIRNALPVPADQYGGGTPGSEYNYWAEVPLTVPSNATYAYIELLYQPTSFEYQQFLVLSNNRQNAFLADEGINMFKAWLNTGMAEPYVMTVGEWGQAQTPPQIEMTVDSLTSWSVDRKGNFVAMSDAFGSRDTVGIKAHSVDQDGVALSGSQVFVEIIAPDGSLEISLQGFSDANGDVYMTWKTGRKQATGTYTVNVVNVINGNYVYNPGLPGSATSDTFAVQ